ncbi:MAG: glycosyltransferase family 2 protein [Mailhella sp.]|nr:glycosyltransferase family 2 protein [Mailhella sp.]
MEHSQVGVIILTYNDWENTLACLECVHAQVGLPRRIVVCDNASDNEVADRILEEWKLLAARTGQPEPVESYGSDLSAAPLVLLRSEEPQTVAGAMNTGIRFLLYDRECQAFWLLRNDARPENFVLEALLRHLSDEDIQKTIGIVGSTQLVGDSDILECAAGGRWSRWTGDQLPLDKGLERHGLSDRSEIARKLDYVSDASCLVTRELTDKIGLFDERFCGFYEDVEYGLRARRSGFALNWAPGAIVRRMGCSTANLTPFLSVTDDPELAPKDDMEFIRARFFLLKREHPVAMPFLLALLPFSWRTFRTRRGRFFMVMRAACDGAAGRVGTPMRRGPSASADDPGQADV